MDFCCLFIGSLHFYCQSKEKEKETFPFQEVFGIHHFKYDFVSLIPTKSERMTRNKASCLLSRYIVSYVFWTEQTRMIWTS